MRHTESVSRRRFRVNMIKLPEVLGNDHQVHLFLMHDIERRHAFAEEVFHVKDFFGKSVPSLDIVHEKQMHLMIVSQDLGEFYHIHPEPSPGDAFRVPHTFPYGGNYKLYADYTPVGGTNRIEVFDLKVLGEPRRPIPLGTRELKTATVDGIKMVLAADRPLRTGEDIGLSMSLFDAK